MSGIARAQSATDSSRDASSSISKTLARFCSSSGVRRSTSNVASPASPRPAATRLLRGLRRSLPLPCAKMTSPFASVGIPRSPSRRSRPACTSFTSVTLVLSMSLALESSCQFGLHQRMLLSRFLDVLAAPWAGLLAGRELGAELLELFLRPSHARVPSTLAFLFGGIDYDSRTGLGLRIRW